MTALDHRVQDPTISPSELLNDNPFRLGDNLCLIEAFLTAVAWIPVKQPEQL
jgi:hypothetical protein